MFRNLWLMHAWLSAIVSINEKKTHKKTNEKNVIDHNNSADTNIKELSVENDSLVHSRDTH